MNIQNVTAAIARLLVSALLILSAGQVSAAPGFTIKEALTYTGKMTPNSPIDVGLDVRGVKLESIFFGDNMEALVILWNKTPATVRPEVGIGLFDKSGTLLATGYASSKFSSSTVRAGKQKNVTLRFDKFIENYQNVAKFQLVFSVVEKKSGSSRSSSDNEF